MNDAADIGAESGEAGTPPQQGEMPFAIVEGEPVTEMPRDLYIPPQALEVFLEAFEGPLDLLLYLIRRQNLDVLDIPIADITRQYMEYIQLMQELDLELAGEYLLMAAMLAEEAQAAKLHDPTVPRKPHREPKAKRSIGNRLCARPWMASSGFALLAIRLCHNSLLCHCEVAEGDRGNLYSDDI